MAAEPGRSTPAPGVSPWEIAGAEGERRPRRESAHEYTTTHSLAAREEIIQRRDRGREPHRQALNLEEALEHSSFEHTQFRGRYIDLATKRDGSAVLRMYVPRQEVPKALTLLDAFGLPLSFDVQRWRNHDALRGDDTSPDRGPTSQHEGGG